MKPDRKKKSDLPMLWMTLTIKGAEWPVFLTNDVQLLGEDNDACCNTATSTIYIASWLPASQIHTALIHEVLHAIIFSMGVGQLIQSIIDVEDHDESEERLVSLLSVDLFDTLQRNGIIKLPKLPNLSPEAKQKKSK
jgi:hypothetical protein